jgi:hypothetical protein
LFTSNINQNKNGLNAHTCKPSVGKRNQVTLLKQQGVGEKKHRKINNIRYTASRYKSHVGVQGTNTALKRGSYISRSSRNYQPTAITYIAKEGVGDGQGLLIFMSIFHIRQPDTCYFNIVHDDDDDHQQQQKRQYIVNIIIILHYHYYQYIIIISIIIFIINSIFLHFSIQLHAELYL